MGKKTTSVLFIAFFLVLKSALASYWSYSDSHTYLFPSLPGNFNSSWQESPMGIFAVGFIDSALGATVRATDDFSRNTDSGKCSAEITVPNASYSGTGISWSMSGATSDSGNGQVGVKIFNKGETTINYTATDGTSSAEDSVVITVTDSEDPKITLGSDISRTTDTDQCTASIVIPNVTFSDNCSGSSLSWSMSGATTGSGTNQVGTHTFNIGTTDITYKVTDASNNVISETLSVTVTDEQIPVITHNGDQNLTNDTGQCGAGFSVSATADDNCTVGNPVGTRSDGAALTALFPVGTTTITWSITDANGNAAVDQVQTINVTDSEDPKITLGSDISKTTDTDQCTASIAIPDVNFSDNCSGSSLSWSMSGATSGSGNNQVGTHSFNIGTTNITYTVTDASNNDISETLSVTVTDEQIPVITHNGDQNLTNDTGQCGAGFSVSATADDNCTVGNPVGTRSDGAALTALFPVGTTTITWSITDANGNAAVDQVQTINVTDSEDPKITLGSDISKTTDTDQCTASIAIPDVNFSDNCSGSSLSWSMSGATSGSGNNQVGTHTFNIGTTDITYKVTDASNNVISETLSVTVTDEQIPVITHNGDQNLTNDTGQCGAGFSVSATADDNCTVGNPVGTRSDGAALTALFPVGTTTITWSKTDANGNAAVDQVQTINVTDSEDPKITLGSDISKTTDTDQCTASIVIPNVTFSDNCSGSSLSWSMSGATSGSGNNQVGTHTFNIGTTDITYKVTDASNNVISETLSVTVADEQIPVITHNGDQNLTNDTGQCGAGFSVSATADDNCTVGNPVGTRSDGQALTALFPVGTTTITWSITDANGNAAVDQVQTINVTDSEYPKITLGSDISKTTDTDQCTASIAIPDVNFSDNCSGSSLSWSMSGATSGSGNNQVGTNTFNIGTTDITYKVTDASNNDISETLSVTVTDEQIPVITHNGDQNLTNDTGKCGASFSVSATADDNCSVGNPTGTRSDGAALNALFPVGTTTITWSVTDANSNDATSVIQTITVTDDEAPVITHDGDKTVNNDPGVCEATVTVSASASDNCSVDNPTGTRNDGKALTYPYPVGTTIITWAVTDSNGNPANSVEQKVTVTDNEAPATPQLEDILWGCEKTLEAPTTTDNCSGIITATANRSLTFSSSGNITWTFTDAAGNSSQVIQKVTIDPLVAPTEQVNILCHGDSTGEITINASGGVAPYSYQWSDSYTGEQRTGLPAGDYNIIVGDVNGCQTSVTVTLTQPEPLAISESTFTPVTCHSAGDGTFTAGTVTGGTPQYEYKITGRSYQSTDNFSNLSPGDYTLTIRDLNGCFLEEDFTITEPEELQMEDPSSTQVSCFGGDDGRVTAGTVRGGNGDYQYSINNVDYGPETAFSGLSAGTYTIFVKDKNGCALQKTVTVEQPETLTANVQKTDVTCFGAKNGTITVLDPSGGSGSYEFSRDGETWQSEPNFTSLNIGSYPISMRDAAHPDCIMPLNSSIEIKQPSQLEATVTTNHTTTYGSATGSATVNPSGGTAGYTYEWRFTGNSSVVTTTKTANNLSAGEYEVTVTDMNGCETTVYQVIIRDAVFAEIESATICEGDNIVENQIRTAYFRIGNLTAVGGFGNYDYTWDFGNETTATGPGEHAITYSTPGNKTITLTIVDKDDDGNINQTFIITQQQYVGLCHEPCGQAQNAQFDVDAIYIGDIDGNPLPDDPNACNEATPKYLFLPVSKDVNMYNPYTEITFKTTNGLTDQFETQTDTGCKDEEQIDEIPENENSGKPNRVGKFIRLTANPIEYNCGDGLQVEAFYITYTNNSKKDCLSNNRGFCYSINDPVVVPTPVYVEAIPTPINCKEASTGIIRAKGTGGFAPYTYNITGEDDIYTTSNTFTGLSSGEYTVYLKDSRGNKNSTTVTVSEPSSKVSAPATVKNPLCFGDLGEATVDASGGTPFSSGPAYQYLWNDPQQQTTSIASNLPAGTYTVTVTDANGCQAINEVIITQPQQLTKPEVGPDQSFGCGFTSTVLSGNTPEAGVGTWSISSGTGGTITDVHNSTSTFTGKPGETYVLLWTIANEDGNCFDSEDLVVTFAPECSTLDFDGLDDYITFGNNYSLSSGNFTLEAWIRPKSVSGIRTVLSKRNSQAPSSAGFDLIINNGAPTFRWNGNSVSTSYKVGTDRWYHLAVIFTGSQVELYVDGLRVGTKTASSPTSNDFPFLIGAMHKPATPTMPVNFFKGWIEEVRIWKKALSVEQIRYMMNQRIEDNGGAVKGEIMPKNVPGELTWANLSGYYRLMANEVGDSGTTLDRAANPITGYLKNIESLQQNTAPLPYISEADGVWKNRSAWDIHIGAEGDNFWTWPNDKGINGGSIDWNIASISHSLNSGNQDITLLGFFIKGGKLDMLGDNPSRSANGSYSAGSGNGLTVTHYLELNGSIDLNGESQLIQTEGSELAGTGTLERDQQGTASSYNYNYFSSPVSTKGHASNSGYKIGEKVGEDYLGVLYDGSNPEEPKPIDFNYQYHWADGALQTPIHISTYWLYKFFGAANQYSQWDWVGKDGHLNTGEGFTMKGSSGWAGILQYQNYVFRGMPNNGDISLYIGTGENYLIGNPYPSAIDANKFIKENLKDVPEGKNSKNLFNGSLYFWSHFSGQTHYLVRYIGGYAVYNLSGGIQAIANDARINATGEKGGERPQQYIPVGQAFFVNSVLDESITKGFSDITLSPGDIHFKNSQRIFVTENDKNLSVFHSADRKDRKMSFSESLSAVASTATSLGEERQRFWISFSSPAGYYREILVTRDPETTTGFDLGYDAPLNEDNLEDMYWLINDYEFVIQGVPDFADDRELPIGLKTSQEGEFTIAIEELENIPDELNIYVRDSINDSYHDLRESDFIGNVAVGKDHKSFSIVFSIPEEQSNPDEGGGEPGNPGEGEPDKGGSNGSPDEGGAEEPGIPTGGKLLLVYSGTEKAVIIQNPSLLNIEKAVLFNGLGQELQHFILNSSEARIPVAVEVTNTGVYFIRVYYSDGTASLKFLVE